GICEHVGLEGFLATQKRHLQDVDQGAKERREVIRTVVETCGMVRHEDSHYFYGALDRANALPDRIEESSKPEASKIKMLGRYLTDMANMNPIAGDYKITSSRCKHRKVN